MTGESETTSGEVHVTVESLGGIDHVDLTFGRGVTILPGRNATNRTSLLSALGGVLGGSTASLKSDADEGRVRLSIGDAEFTRTYARRAGTVVTDGRPYTDDETLVDHFVALFEDNPARRAVERDGDLRDVIMAPVDTAAIKDRIAELASEKRDIEDEIDAVTRQRNRLPELEERRIDIETDIAEVDDTLEGLRADVSERESKIDAAEEAAAAIDELSERRARLGRLTDRLETKRAEREALEEELESLREELASTRDHEEDALAELEAELQAVREEKRSLDDTVASLTTLIEFNRAVLAGERVLPAVPGEDPEIPTALRPEDERELTCWTCGSTVRRGTIDDRLDDLRELVAEKRAVRDDRQDRAAELQERREELRRSANRLETLERRIAETESRLEATVTTVEELEEKSAEVAEEIRELEERAAETSSNRSQDLLDRYDRIGELEYERGQLEQQRADVAERIGEIESLPDVGDLEDRLERIEDEMEAERTRIERLERSAVEEFNEHMERLLDVLDYGNLSRVWIERKTPAAPEDDATFDLHIVRESADRAGYEDTIDTLSESEREVVGLVVALAGYLVHDVYETVPFMLLDSVEAIDAPRLDAVIDYFAEYVDHLVVALLPEDAARIDAEHERVTLGPILS